MKKQQQPSSENSRGGSIKNKYSIKKTCPKN